MPDGTRDMADQASPKDEATEEAKPFRLLDLPPEIWTRIVKMAVTKPTRLKAQIDYDGKNYPVDFGVPPIAQTCRLIRTEALKIYYGCNTFHVHADCVPSTLEYYRQWVRARMIDKTWTLIKQGSLTCCCYPLERMQALLGQIFSSHEVQVELLEDPPRPYSKTFWVQVKVVNEDEAEAWMEENKPVVRSRPADGADSEDEL